MKIRRVFVLPLAWMLAAGASLDAQITTVGAQTWRQGADGLPGNAESGDNFGQSLAHGDFNGDGYQDLAIGTPAESGSRGVVYVLYGGPDGLTAEGVQEIRQGVDGIDGSETRGDAFGWAVEAGDFNADGFDDLAVGVPGEDSARGVAHVIYGSEDGLTSQGEQVWRQDQLEGSGRQVNDQFGFSLAVGDFSGDGIDDLAVGSPGEQNFSGLAHVIYGSTGAGLTENGNQRWRQSADDIPGSRENGDFFGFALGAGDLNGDEIDELVIGVPGEDGGEGQLHVLFGANGRLTGSGNQRWRPGEDGLTGEANNGDAFGEVIEVGNLNGDPYDDLVFSGLGENNNGGEVIIMYGSNAGPTPSGAQRWVQGFKNLPDSLESGDRFGSSLAIGDIDGDGLGDLAVGVRGEDGNIGVVHVIFGSTPRLDGGRNQAFAQGFDGVPDGGEPSDDFGFSVEIGDFGRGRGADLAIGVPGEDNRRGVVQVLYGETMFDRSEPRISSAVGAGLSAPPVRTASPNGLMTLFGANFAEPDTFRTLTPEDLVGGRVPTNLDGICVELNGRRSPIFGVFAIDEMNQVNFQASRLPGEEAVVIELIRNCGRLDEVRTDAFEIAAAPVAPEFFFFVGAQDGVSPIAAVNETTGRLVGEPGLIPGAAFQPAREGEAVTLYLTGLGETNPRVDPGELPDGAAPTAQPVRVTVGGVELQPLYAGASPGFAGLFQVSFVVPPDLGQGPRPIVVTIGDAEPASTPPGGFLVFQ